jgi:hypothetical protein
MSISPTKTKRRFKMSGAPKISNEFPDENCIAWRDNGLKYSDPAGEFWGTVVSGSAGFITELWGQGLFPSGPIPSIVAGIISIYFGKKIGEFGFGENKTIGKIIGGGAGLIGAAAEVCARDAYPQVAPLAAKALPVVWHWAFG